MDEFTDLHRTITQLLLCHGIIEETRLIKLFQTHSSIAELDRMVTYSSESFNKFMADISKKIAYVGLSTMKGISEHDGKPYWTIGNFSEDTLAELGTEYTTSDLIVLKKALETILNIDDGSGQVSSTLLIHECSLTKRVLSKRQIQDILDKLVQDHWLIYDFFEIIRRGSYSLHTRFLIEMSPYLQKNYGSRLNSCHLCHNIATKYKRCPNRTCSVKIHKHCASRYFSNRLEPKCPASCGSLWAENTEYRQTVDDTVNLNEGESHMIRRSGRGN